MKKFYYLLILCLGFGIKNLSAQFQYFPPNSASDFWDTIQPSSLGWCQDNVDELFSFLEENDTKSFILLKDGKIVLEKYFNNHNATQAWYWASAGKSLTAFIVGLAQEEGFLKIDSPTTKYLGKNWTSCSVEDEEKITLKDHLTLTTGMDYNVPDQNCRADSCMNCKNEVGSHWYYHNATYTLLHDVLSSVLPTTTNQYIRQKLNQKIGFSGSFLPLDNNIVYFSNARAMARFGLLMANNGVWDGDTIMKDQNYFNAMINSSQELNKSYGYLWWLNGKASFKLPQSDFVFNGSLMVDAPKDLWVAAGLNGQFLNISQQEGLIMVRMGEENSVTLVPTIFNNLIWQKINALPCSSSLPKIENSSIQIHPNPVENILKIHSPRHSINITLFDITGKKMIATTLNQGANIIDLSNLPKGIYYLLSENGYQKVIKL
jgi:CubicO group peptidase (beta-lactamase class C family)